LKRDHPGYAHTHEHVDKALDAMEDVLEEMKRAAAARK